jgi:two-component system LytT family response regulator
VTVIGEAADVAQAAVALSRDRPDVVFLDIRLGRESGFTVLPAMAPATALVFVTAFDEYAVRAFEVNALDYLLKPVDPERLAATLGRLRGLGTPPAAARPPAGTLSARDWLFLRDGARDTFLRVADVAAVTAEGDYTRVLAVNGSHRLVHRSLADWQARLPETSFARVHRSALVNLHHVLEVRRADGLSGQLIVRGVPQPLAMSRRAAALLRRRLR